jgi:hypothetical protein
VQRRGGGDAQVKDWPCRQCGKFAFPRPDVICYWCRKDPTRKNTHATLTRQ